MSLYLCCSALHCTGLYVVSECTLRTFTYLAADVAHRDRRHHCGPCVDSWGRPHIPHSLFTALYRHCASILLLVQYRKRHLVYLTHIHQCFHPTLCGQMPDWPTHRKKINTYPHCLSCCYPLSADLPSTAPTSTSTCR